MGICQESEYIQIKAYVKRAESGKGGQDHQSNLRKMSEYECIEDVCYVFIL
jgi:hypothetical protein